MLSFLFAAFLSQSAFAQQVCIVPKSVTKGTRLKTAEKETMDFYPGEELKQISVNSKKKQIVVGLGDFKYTVGMRNLLRRRKPSCGLKLCVRLKNKNQYYKSPNEYDTSGTIADGIYPVMTRSGAWYRVQTNENFVWVSAAQFMASKADCDAPVTTEVSEEIYQPAMVSDEDRELKRDVDRYRWRFGMEVGWIQATSSKPLEGLLSPNPGGATVVNNDSFDSPFIEEITDGSGWFIGATMEAFLWSELKAKYSVGYKRKTIDVVARPNPPAVGSVTYDELAKEEYAEEFGFVYINTVIKHEGLRVFGITFQPGVNVGVDYSTDVYTQEFQTAPGKQSIYTKDAGYKTWEFYYGPRVDIIWRGFNVGAVVNFNSYDLEPTLIFGIQF